MTTIPEGPQEPYMTPELSSEIKRALEGDSNDAEHDALASVADHFGISWTSPYADDRPERPVYTGDGRKVPGLTIAGDDATAIFRHYGRAVSEEEADRVMTRFESGATYDSAAPYPNEPDFYVWLACEQNNEISEHFTNLDDAKNAIPNEAGARLVRMDSWGEFEGVEV